MSSVATVGTPHAGGLQAGEGAVHGGGCVVVGGGEDVGVDVGGDVDAGVSEDVAHDLERHALASNSEAALWRSSWGCQCVDLSLFGAASVDHVRGA